MLSVSGLVDLVAKATFFTSTFTSDVFTSDGRVRCADGNLAPHAACCPFYALRDDLQANL